MKIAKNFQLKVFAVSPPHFNLYSSFLSSFSSGKSSVPSSLASTGINNTPPTDKFTTNTSFGDLEPFSLTTFFALYSKIKKIILSTKPEPPPPHKRAYPKQPSLLDLLASQPVNDDTWTLYNMLRTAYSLSPTPELRAKFDAEYFKNLLQFVLEKVTSPQLCIDRISRVIKDMRTIFGCELDNECVKYIIGGYLHWGRFGEVESVMHTIVDTFPIESRELALTAILKVYNAMYNTFGIEKVLSELYYLNGLKVRKYIPVRRSKLFPALLKVLDKRPSVHEVRWNLEMKTIEVMLESYTLLQQPENALYLIDLAHRCKAITVKVYRNALETLFQLAQRKTKDHQHKHIFAYARDLFTATMKRYQTDANVFQLMYKLETMCNRMDFSKRKIAFRKRKYLKFNPEYMSNLLHRRLKFGEYKKAKLLFYRYYYLKIRPNRKSRKYWLHKKDALDISKVYSNYNYSLSIYPRTDDAYRAFRKCRSLQAKTIVPTLRRLSHVHKSYRKAKDYGIGPTSEDFQILFFNMLSSKAFEDWYRAKRIYRMMVKRFDPPIWMMRAYARLLEESGESGGEIERLYRAADRKSRNSIFSQVYISPFNKTWFE